MPFHFHLLNYTSKLHCRITEKQHLHLNTILANSRQISYGSLTKCFVFELVSSELCCLLGFCCLHGSNIDRIIDGTSAIFNLAFLSKNNITFQETF